MALQLQGLAVAAAPWVVQLLGSVLICSNCQASPWQLPHSSPLTQRAAEGSTGGDPGFVWPGAGQPQRAAGLQLFHRRSEPGSLACHMQELNWAVRGACTLWLLCGCYRARLASRTQPSGVAAAAEKLE